MADKNIDIAIRTTGAQRAAQDIQRVEGSLEDLGQQAPRTAQQIDQVGDSMQDLGTGQQGGRRGNAGMAALEASRAFEDMQYGIRGVLNNIPSLVLSLGGTAGLAGAISVAAVGASILWEKFSGGAKKAKEETGDMLETFKQLVDVYTELDANNAEDRKKAAEQAAKGLEQAISRISLGQLITGNRAGLQAAREVAAESLQLANDRIRLAEVEKAVQLASGQDAKRLAEERAQVIDRILQSELAISEANRQRELAAAQDKVAGAGAKVDATRAADSVLAQQANELRQQYDALIGAATAETQARITAANQTEQELITAREALAVRQKELELDPNRNELLRPLEDTVRRLTDSLNTLRGPSEEETRKYLEAEIPRQSLEKLQPQLDASAKAQADAARAMTEATLALANLRQSQGVARQSEAELKAAQQIGQVGADITQAARDAIAQIQANAAQQGRQPNAAEQETIGAIQKLVNDTTPDAQQGGQLAGILQQLSNNLNAKDQNLINGVDQIIRNVSTMATRVQQIRDKIGDMQQQINQIKSAL